ncbi:hypothetical protein LX87_04117 [Larkinella arboricola]|uniref:Uncharacterized protein n=1 Tax=Larkinella arboricola TaxID=643671 RepID=A0A327WSC5_LARAB|nr:hypothetical protein [Larkinella arboricola]RAJ94232.1 hypothetical protein LX87_04117 [Larkinella arboricola]
MGTNTQTVEYHRRKRKEGLTHQAAVNMTFTVQAANDRFLKEVPGADAIQQYLEDLTTRLRNVVSAWSLETLTAIEKDYLELPKVWTPEITLLEVFDKFDAGTLAEWPDEILQDAQLMVSELSAVLKKHSNESFFITHQRPPVSTDQLDKLSDHILTTLNNRYGCND